MAWTPGGNSNDSPELASAHINLARASAPVSPVSGDDMDDGSLLMVGCPEGLADGTGGLVESDVFKVGDRLGFNDRLGISTGAVDTLEIGCHVGLSVSSGAPATLEIGCHVGGCV